MDSNPPGSSVHGISQARILECVASPFSRESSQPRDNLPNPGIKPTFPALLGGFFTTRPPEKSAYKLRIHLLPQMIISVHAPASLFPYNTGCFPFLVRNTLLNIFHYVELFVNSNHEREAQDLSFCFLWASRENKGFRNGFPRNIVGHL